MPCKAINANNARLANTSQGGTCSKHDGGGGSDGASYWETLLKNIWAWNFKYTPQKHPKYAPKKQDWKRKILHYIVIFISIFSGMHMLLKNVWIKSVNPKISRIGRQKQKNDFFLIWPKEPIWLPVFGNDIKRLDFLFFSSKFAKLENSATGPSAAAMRLEIWHMFNMLVWTYQTLS